MEDKVKIPESLRKVRHISRLGVHTFHEHHYFIYDLAKDYKDRKINYVEIGCFEGASACLMVQRPNTNVISIDIGKPRPPKIAISNVAKFNKYKNEYHYIQGRSDDPKVMIKLLKLLRNQGIHILFIDGGHKFNNVVADFLTYSSLVNNNGFIVIDDMLAPSCQEVLTAVEFLKSVAFKDYKVIDYYKDNLYGARFPNPVVVGSNEFVLKKI